MKKIWVVESGSYSDYKVDGVFSTKENAELFVEEFDECSWSEMSIDCWNLDPAINNLKKGLSLFSIKMNKEGAVENISKTSAYNIDRIKAYSFFRKRLREESFDYMDYVCYAKDEDHAVKIAGEHRARILAADAWGDNRRHIK